MQPKTFNFWQQWLTWANVLTLGVGLLVAFAGNSFAFELHNQYTEDVFFGSEPITGATLALKNWLFGIIGGTIVGFHFLMIMISEHAYKRRETWAYRAMWGWFIKLVCN